MTPQPDSFSKQRLQIVSYLAVLAPVIAAIECSDQKPLTEESVCFIVQLIVLHEGKSGTQHGNLEAESEAEAME